MKTFQLQKHSDELNQPQANKDVFLHIFPGLSWLIGARGGCASVQVLTKAQPTVPVPVSRYQQTWTSAAPSLAQPVTRCLSAEQTLYIIKAKPEPLLGSPQSPHI